MTFDHHSAHTRIRRLVRDRETARDLTVADPDTLRDHLAELDSGVTVALATPLVSLDSNVPETTVIMVSHPSVLGP